MCRETDNYSPRDLFALIPTLISFILLIVSIILYKCHLVSIHVSAEIGLLSIAAFLCGCLSICCCTKMCKRRCRRDMIPLPPISYTDV